MQYHSNEALFFIPTDAIALKTGLAINETTIPIIPACGEGVFSIYKVRQVANPSTDETRAPNYYRSFILYYSHKIAGPMYRLKMFLQQKINNEELEPIRFRKTDNEEFHELAAKINEALKLK